MAAAMCVSLTVVSPSGAATALTIEDATGQVIRFGIRTVEPEVSESDA
jgi:hypothetical protein